MPVLRFDGNLKIGEYKWKYQYFPHVAFFVKSSVSYRDLTSKFHSIPLYFSIYSQYITGISR